MGENQLREAKNPNRLNKMVKIFMGTSDDLLFWVLIDTLFLSVVKGFSVSQISLVFTISFWVALAVKWPCYYLVRKLDLGSSVVVSAILFLLAAVFITCGNYVVIIIGQCLYVIAPSFVNLGDIMLKQTCVRATPPEDFVHAKLSSSTIYAVITLVAAIFIDPLMSINKYLPMLLCIATRAFSLILSIAIKLSKDWTNGDENVIEKIDSKIGKSNLSYLVMAVGIGTFFNLAAPNLRLLLEDSMSVVMTESFEIRCFSYVIIGTRVAKMLGNFILKRMTAFSKRYGVMSIYTLLATLMIPLLGILSCFMGGKIAIVCAGMALVLFYLTFDILCVLRAEALFDGLEQKQIVLMLYTRDTAVTVFSALLSTCVTIMLVKWGMGVVMPLLLLIMMATTVFSILGFMLKKK